MPLIKKNFAMKDEMLTWQCGFHANSELGFKEENIAEFGLQDFLRRGTKFIGNIAVWRRSTGGNENGDN